MMRQNAQNRILCIMINKQTQTQERLFSFFRANEYNDPGSNFFVSYFIPELLGKKLKKVV